MSPLSIFAGILCWLSPIILVFYFDFSILKVTIGTSIVLIVITVFLLKKIVDKDDRHFTKLDHFLITGGSSGIGLAFAAEVIKQGASVTILARNKKNLEDARNTLTNILNLEAPDSKQKILVLQADVTQSCKQLQEIIYQAEFEIGPISYLVNCAGTSVCYRFEETPEFEFQKMLNTNFMGSVNITQAIVPLMKKRKRGNIIFFSSGAGLIGIYGYTAYSASKFALLGMAEALQMELKAFNINVTVSFPPDTDTPGYAEEMKTKLEETHKVSESGGLVSANEVAAKTLEDALKGRFMSHVGFNGWLLATACCGMTPVSSLFDLACQVFSMGICRFLGYIYLRDCYKIIKQCAQKESSEKQTQS